MPKHSRFSPEVLERAARLVQDHFRDHASESASIETGDRLQPKSAVSQEQRERATWCTLRRERSGDVVHQVGRRIMSGAGGETVRDHPRHRQSLYTPMQRWRP